MRREDAREGERLLKMVVLGMQPGSGPRLRDILDRFRGGEEVHQQTVCRETEKKDGKAGRSAAFSRHEARGDSPDVLHCPPGIKDGVDAR